jgi:hypothetical protein
MSISNLKYIFPNISQKTKAGQAVKNKAGPVSLTDPTLLFTLEGAPVSQCTLTAKNHSFAALGILARRVYFV